MFLSTHQKKMKKKKKRKTTKKEKNELNKIIFLNPNETPKENEKESRSKELEKRKTFAHSTVCIPYTMLRYTLI